MLWHADDISRGALALLSRAGLLRDTVREQQQGKADTFWAGVAQQNRAADGRAITDFGQLAAQAADRLDAGDNPQQVAEWLRKTAEAISGQRDRGRSSNAPADAAAA
jgi:hypothetical protein